MTNMKKWKMKNGQKIEIKDMTDDHLINTAKMLERMAESKLLNMPCPDFSGDMAQYCLDSDFDTMMEMDSGDLASEYFPIYDEICEEIYKRNLTQRLYETDENDRGW